MIFLLQNRFRRCNGYSRGNRELLLRYADAATPAPAFEFLAEPGRQFEEKGIDHHPRTSWSEGGRTKLVKSGATAILRSLTPGACATPGDERN
jgi:hypothetical protein